MQHTSKCRYMLCVKEMYLHLDVNFRGDYNFLGLV